MRIASVVGARPNFVKIAPLLREMRRHRQITPVLVHTGQHYDEAMSEQFFRDLEIEPPASNLGVGSGSHAVQTAEVMRRLDPLLVDLAPDLVLVVGDVNSTLAAALTAAKRGIPVAHVEAGLRSFDRRMPEEINRVLTDAIADVLFATEQSGCDNLVREGMPRDKIRLVGNVMIDALELFRGRWERSAIFDVVGLAPEEPYAVVTLHRPSNVDETATLAGYLRALNELSRHLPVIFPVHPRVRSHLAAGDRAAGGGAVASGGRDRGIFFLDPLGYLDFIALLSQARIALTDSGGVQEETTALGVPCLTLRDTTERPVTVTHGTNRVIGSDPDRLVTEALRTLADPPVQRGRPPLWDGQAARRIVDALRETHGGRSDSPRIGREPVRLGAGAKGGGSGSS